MKIKFVYKSVQYVLEYTRRTVKEMEKKGFKINELIDKPVTYLPELFAGSFKANHRDVSQETIEEIFKSIPNKMPNPDKYRDLDKDDERYKEKYDEDFNKSLIGVLVSMYNETLNTLMKEPDEKKATAWTVE